MKKVVIIHGWQSSPDREWIPWLKKCLEAKGLEVVVPAMPDKKVPKEEEWVRAIDAAAGKPSLDTFFVGHSLGCIAIVRFLVDLAPGQVFGGALFIAGFSGDIEVPELAEFYSMKGDVRDARSHIEKCSMMYSDDDKHISIEKSEEFIKHLGDTKGILVRGKGHFSEDEGCFELVEGLKEVLSMVGNATIDRRHFRGKV